MKASAHKSWMQRTSSALDSGPTESEQTFQRYWRVFRAQDRKNCGRISIWAVRDALHELGIDPHPDSLFELVDQKVQHAHSLIQFCDFSDFVEIIESQELAQEELEIDLHDVWRVLGGDSEQPNATVGVEQLLSVIAEFECTFPLAQRLSKHGVADSINFPQLKRVLAPPV